MPPRKPDRSHIENAQTRAELTAAFRSIFPGVKVPPWVRDSSLVNARNSMLRSYDSMSAGKSRRGSNVDEALKSLRESTGPGTQGSAVPNVSAKRNPGSRSKLAESSGGKGDASSGEAVADEPVIPPPPRANPGSTSGSDDVYVGAKKIPPFLRHTIAKKHRDDQARALEELPEYIRANGNMSVKRRLSVVGDALVNLGYDHDHAHDIAIDAPLNASSYNDQAVLTALEYAHSISSQQTMSNGSLIRGSLQPNVIPMPDRAYQALVQARYKNTPVRQRMKSSTLGKYATIVSTIGDRLKPVGDRIANVPVPGGIGGLLAVNLIFLAAIVPANPAGYTRLELLWLTLLNRTRLPDKKPRQEAPASALVQAAFAAAESLKEGALAIASTGQNYQDFVQGIQLGGQLLPGIILGVPGSVTGSSYVPPSNTGASPPPPAMPPTPPRSL